MHHGGRGNSLETATTALFIRIKGFNLDKNVDLLVASHTLGSCVQDPVHPIPPFPLMENYPTICICIDCINIIDIHIVHCTDTFSKMNHSALAFVM